MRETVNSDDQLADTSQCLGTQTKGPIAIAEGRDLMDNDLKQYLEGMEARMFAKFAAKDDLERAFAEMRGTFATKQDLDRMFVDIQATFATKEDLERVETTLLTEFHKWASPADMRAKSHAQAIRLIDTELESLAERVEKLEGKKPS